MKQQYLNELTKRGIHLDMSQQCSGSFSKVYFGQSNVLKCKVAIKQIVMSENPTHPSVERQITILQQCDHPNIVKLYEVIKIGNVYFLIMERGQCSLEKIVLSKNMSVSKKVNIVRQILEACHYLYSKSIMHRDIKLQNIIKVKQTYKLIDFGFAIQADINQPILTSFLGNKLGKSPEIFRFQKYDYKSDIWSLGVLFYCILYKKPPYNGDLENMKEEMALPICQNHHPTERDLVDLIRSCLKYRPEERPMWSDIMSHPVMKDTMLTRIIFKKDMLSSTMLIENPEHQALDELFQQFQTIDLRQYPVIQKVLLTLKKIVLYKEVFLDFVSAWIKTYLVDADYSHRGCLVPLYGHLNQLMAELISFTNPPKIDLLRTLMGPEVKLPHLSVNLFTEQENMEYYDYKVTMNKQALSALMAFNHSIAKQQAKYSKNQQTISKILSPQKHKQSLLKVRQCLELVMGVSKGSDGQRDQVTLFRLIQRLENQIHRPLMNDITVTEDIEQFAQNFFRKSIIQVGRSSS